MFLDLYAARDTIQSALAPACEANQFAAYAFSHPLSPLAYSPAARLAAASCELAYRLGKVYGRPAWGLSRTTIAGQDMVVTPRTVRSLPFCELTRFHTSLGDVLPKMLLVAPLSGHHATLLRDTVRSLIAHYDVYVTEWVNARDVPLAAGDFGLDDYVRYVERFVADLRALNPAIPLHIMSVCQPTVPVLAAIARMAARGEELPASLTLMGGPVDARRAPTKVDNLAIEHSHAWFEENMIYPVPHRFRGGGRRVYPGFLQHAGFVAMNPVRHAKSHYEFFLHLLEGDEDDARAHRQFYDEYNAVLDLPARFYLDTIKTVFQDFSLARGTWKMGGKRIDPGCIRKTALLTIEGELDDISGAGQTLAAQELCTGLPSRARKHLIVNGAGHYGIFSGKRWRETVLPEVVKFTQKHTQ